MSLSVPVGPPLEEELLEVLLPVPEPCSLPDDDVADAVLRPEVAIQRAEERYPTPLSDASDPPATLNEVFTQAVQRRFRPVLDSIDPRINAKLDQPFGKDNLRQCFHSQASLRHVLLPLWKSGFLCGRDHDWESFSLAHYPTRVLLDLIDDYGDTPFQGIRGYPEGWDTETEVNQSRVQMATAALLHFNGSVADLVRWIGGPHVGAHRDHFSTFELLGKAGADPEVVSDLERIFLSGIPSLCAAEASEENFSAFYNYGNHSTVDDEPEKTYKAMVKDNRRGFTLLFDPRIVLLMLDCHVTPQGIVDLNSPYKNPRPIFDSSFRPYPWSHAINDWGHKDNEPRLTFASAELGFMVWLYNLRLTYPHLEIYIADDDVSGAFRLMKYHPNLMALHTSVQCGFGVVNTGGTFGDNTSPSNFDPIGLARRQLSQFLWRTSQTLKETILPFLPSLRMAPEPSPEEVASFCPADPDSINTGVLDPQGARLPPPYNMHVDDALYADIGLWLVWTVCASIAGLFGILGWPTNGLVPSPLSSEKFEAWHSHERKLVGRLFNSRTLTVGMLDYKKQQLSDLLSQWLTRKSYELLDIAHLLGVLENHTKYARWARCWYFNLQNNVRRILHQRHEILLRRYNRDQRELAFKRQLPGNLLDRLGHLVTSERARLLWSTRQKFSVDPATRSALINLHRYVTMTSNPWEVPLGMIIPREPHFWSRGDASLRGGGAFCPGLRFWFDVSWSPATRRGIRDVKPSSPGFVHINALEFIVVILQLAAIRVRLDTMTPAQELLYFPHGRPHIPVWFGETDNTVSCSWENRATARTPQGQGLVGVYAELLRTSHVHTQCKHLAGIDNVVADDISRNDFSLDSSSRCLQLFQKHPCLGSYDYFLPSPEFVRLLTSRLYSGPVVDPCVLPKALGRFVPGGCTTFGSVSL